MPPDSSRGYFVSKPPSPVSSSRSPACLRYWRGSSPSISTEKSTLSSTERHGSSTGCWKTKPTSVNGSLTAVSRTEQKASGFALAGVAAVISPSGVRVGVTGIAAKAYRATGVEQALKGQTTANAIALAATHAADGVEPLSDIHASAAYRPPPPPGN